METKFYMEQMLEVFKSMLQETKLINNHLKDISDTLDKIYVG